MSFLCFLLFVAIATVAIIHSGSSAWMFFERKRGVIIRSLRSLRCAAFTAAIG